jgi:hypothetical protein
MRILLIITICSLLTCTSLSSDKKKDARAEKETADTSEISLTGDSLQTIHRLQFGFMDSVSKKFKLSINK